MRIDNLEAMNHHQAGMVIGSAELKRQSDQAKRFCNEGYRTHPQLSSVKSAFQSLQPEQLQKVLKNAQQAMGGNGATTQVNSQNIPQLQMPTFTRAQNSDNSKLSASAAMTELFGKITKLVTETSLSNLVTRLQNYNSMMDGAVSAYSHLAEQLELQGMKWANANDVLKDAQRQSDALAQNIEQAQLALNDAQKKLNELEAEAAKQEPVPESLQKQIMIAKTAVGNALAMLTQAQTANNSFVEKTLNPAIKEEQIARVELGKLQLKSKELINTLSPQQQYSVEQQCKQVNEQAKTLTFLMALMSQLIDKSSSENLEATAELKQKLAEASAKDAEKKAKEYEAEVRKAEDLQKALGCIGKVLGWLITAVSFVLAAFTGGASLALAAIGLALAMGDEICQAVSGRSFMADAMKPLMEKIVKPLMEFMGKVYSAILESLGVPKSKAEMIGQILGAIAAAVIFVAGAMVAGSVMSKLSGVIMDKIGTNIVEKTVVQRLLNSAIGRMLKRLNQGVGRLLGMNEIKMAQIANRTKMAQNVARLGDTVNQSVGGCVVSNMMVDASKVGAQMMKDAALQDLLNEMMNRAIDIFSHRMETVNQIIKDISVVAENQEQAGKYITKQMNTVAV
ncbi:TPA: type III secretion system translocon subunit SctE [Escherichia coli]|uniref:type III secretion system translocon subunit SctE n=1 Tax=Escherichia coli TaxID=562 RepID=UPI000BE31799|nr:type III secretion system translocon subunit SctE [Escherichia coli]MBS9316432.1 type III secretion system translocon subunit SctE [Escherichia coli]